MKDEIDNLSTFKMETSVNVVSRRMNELESHSPCISSLMARNLESSECSFALFAARVRK